jgi:hypothetical protein
VRLADNLRLSTQSVRILGCDHVESGVLVKEGVDVHSIAALGHVRRDLGDVRLAIAHINTQIGLIV